MKKSYILTKRDFRKCLQVSLRKYSILAPVKFSGGAYFREVSRRDLLNIDLFGSRPFMSPKFALFPPFKTSFTFEKAGRKIQITPIKREDQKTILLGVKPCDVRGLHTLSMVFLTPSPDPEYQRIRENLILASADCVETADYCFCSSFGISPISGEGSDLHVSDLGSRVIVTAYTKKGLALLTEAGGKLVKPSKAEILGWEVRRRRIEDKVAAIQYQFDMDLIRKNIGKLFYEPIWGELNPVWERLSLRCVECGGCTFVCPVCHCYYVTDRANQSRGERFQVWDTCLFEGYSRMAGGVNPRPRLPDRLRHWYFCKFSYFPTKYNEFGCVGCGRCAQACFGRIDVREVLYSFTSIFKQFRDVLDRVVTKYWPI